VLEATQESPDIENTPNEDANQNEFHHHEKVIGDESVSGICLTNTCQYLDSKLCEKNIDSSLYPNHKNEKNTLQDSDLSHRFLCQVIRPTVRNPFDS